MKKRVLLVLFAAMLTFAGCGKSDVASTANVESTADASAQGSENVVLDDITADGNQENADYTEQIRAEVADAKNASSLQDELDIITDLGEKYDSLRMSSETQTELNENSQWIFLVWDEELNSLWRRMSDELDKTTKDEILARQRVWVAMKDDAADHLSAIYEGGSIQPMIYNEEMADLTRRRAYVLADEFAKYRGEKFTMPTRDNTGYFVDTQGTTEEYSSMTLAPGMEGDSLIITVSLYRVGELTGYGEATSEGISFVSDDGNVQATIKIDFDSASFTVDEASDSIVNAGEAFDFDLAF